MTRVKEEIDYLIDRYGNKVEFQDKELRTMISEYQDEAADLREQYGVILEKAAAAGISADNAENSAQEAADTAQELADSMETVQHIYDQYESYEQQVLEQNTAIANNNTAQLNVIDQQTTAKVAAQVAAMQVIEGQTVIDSTLTVSGAAAEAAKVGTEISELKNDLKTKGENILPIKYYRSTLANPYTVNGITFTVLDDGGILINGTATANAAFDIINPNDQIPIKTGMYTASMNLVGSNTTFVFGIAIKNGSATDWGIVRGNPVTKVISNDTVYRALITVYAGYTADNIVIYPMFERGYFGSDYVESKYNKYNLFNDINAILNTAYFKRDDIRANTDLNTLTSNGTYLLYNGYTYDNAPEWYTGGAAWLIVFSNSNNAQIAQYFIRFTTGETYYRRMGTFDTTVTWYPWIKYYTNESLLYKNLAGKKLSIVGDSISTYSGYLPADYVTYYPYGDLDNVNKTWWKQVIDTAGMSLLVNASWSGSWVCYDSNGSVSADSAKIAYTDARINALGENPDIIIVFIGTNDFIHNGGNPLGTFDINSELPGEVTPITDFKPAYATMINKIRTRYPAAHVYCCTLLERYRGTADQSYPIKNGSGVSLASYNRAILDIAEWTGCRVIRLDTAFSLGQIPELTVDGTLHPNAAGAKIIANYVLTVLAREEKSLI